MNTDCLYREKEMIPRHVLETHKTTLRRFEDMPTQWLGDYVAEYIRDLDQHSGPKKVLYLCGMMEWLYSIGVLEGKKQAVKAVEKVILEYT